MTQDRNISDRVKIAVRQVYGGVCQYCQCGDANHVDHIVPLAKDGLDDVENLILSCESCNLRKGVALIPDTYVALILGIAAQKAPLIRKMLAPKEKKEKPLPEKFKKAITPRKPKQKIIGSFWQLEKPVFKEQKEPTEEQIEFLRELAEMDFPRQITDKKMQDGLFGKGILRNCPFLFLEEHYVMEDGSI